MTLKEILIDGGGLLLAAMTVIQFTPIEINPWSSLARAIGRAFNGGDVMKELALNRKALEVHIADGHRARILQFNTELLRNIPHTKEEYDDVLKSIDEYERYCKEHTDYKNNRATLAIENIKNVYQDRLQQHDFLAY